MKIMYNFERCDSEKQSRDQEVNELDVEKQSNNTRNVVYEAAEESIEIKVKYGTKKKFTA